MNKYFYILGIVVLTVIGIGFVLMRPKTDTKMEERQTNGEMLQTVNETKIIATDVVYFEGANGYFVQPAASGTYPGVVMIHENRGLNSGVRSMAEQLAKEGHLVLAVDLLGKSVETQEEARGLTANYNQQTGIKNMRAAVEFLKKNGATKVASLGWCFGGGQSLQLALSGEKMDATVIYYGRLATTTEALAPIAWPVLGIFGGADQSISVESVNQFDAALDAKKIDNEIYIYPGVGHAFANPSGMNYAPNETKDAWAKTVTFLKTHLAE